ncbi:DNA repair exonuclease [Bacillus sp. 31A1R]|uniref:DNA repair exonuclease n=1 Tax=Robertmurraya mangrovi TaxID=3098077 RepID=A0ABU5IST5_9BACI|nr:DNA repair exonuclease [Bacillus sp. 31A1R]MDZ5470196.1 DNA repair exonuclease [Bacillus sp. 31A1R]
MKEIKFIHTADLHLDSPLLGLKYLPIDIFKRLQESTFHALRKIIDTAIDQKVDFIIIAGDIFDGEDRSIRAQVRFKKEMERLEKHNISVFVIHGNHDHLSGNWTKIEMPENVFVFGENVEVKGFSTSHGVTASIYGFSYPVRHVYERKIDSYHKEMDADFHIGILHGNLEGGTDHGNYAPFQLKDLMDKGFDYWALGHIHKRTILSEQPPIIYPGNTQGRHKKESGPKGCYIVTLNEYQSDLTFIETSDVIWTTENIDARDCKTFDDLYRLCLQTMDGLRKEGVGQLLNFSIVNLNNEFLNLQYLKDELLDALQEEEKVEDNLIWPYNIELEEAVGWKRNELASESDFYEEIFRVMDGLQNIDEMVASLYEHPVGRKFLQPLTTEVVASVKKEAEKILIQGLLKK